MNMALTFEKVHSGGYVIGDVNDRGVLVADSALVSLVDCDSFQVRDPASGRVHRCTVGMGLYTPPELAGCRFTDVDRTTVHDLFGLAVLIYQLLLGSHPFQVKAPRRPDVLTIEDAIRAGLYPDQATDVLQPPLAAPLDLLPVSTRQLFRDAFGAAPPSRPTAAHWAADLWTIDRDLARCARNDNHFFPSHGAECPWCTWTTRVGGRDPFPSSDTIRAGAHLARTDSIRRRPAPRPRQPVSNWSRAGAMRRERGDSPPAGSGPRVPFSRGRR
jgi:DNA-binding helix-hairpin-helix protein with protein kinase domain